MKKWSALIILAAAQFIMVLDSTVMNVSMTEVAADIGTTISGLQTAITLYTLTMAAFMLTGGKLGDIWGRKRTFKIGAVVYGIGSLITSISPSLGVLIFGWSMVEGLGAILVIPAIAALAAANYSGKDRAIAFAAIGGISGAAAAAGPLIGGFMTTYLSWRYVFAAETVIMIFVLLYSSKLADSTDKIKSKPIDIPSVFLSVAGMGSLVFGMLQSKTWGFITPKGALTINGNEITPFGISMVAYLILLGIVLMWVFYRRQQKLLEANANPLLDVGLLKIPRLRSGLLVLMSQYTITAAVFFVIPVYLQTVLGMDALQTGIKILPLSVAVILFSVVGSRLAGRYALRKVVRIGQLTLALGAAFVMIAINPTLEGFIFGLSMFVLGSGLGILASQIGNINMSSVKPDQTSEAGGLQGTFQNLGSSFGTALIGSIMIASLTTNFVTSINDSDLPDNIKTTIQQGSTAGIPVVSASSVESTAESKGVPQNEAEEIADTYKEAQIQGLKEAAFFIIVIALFSLPLSRYIPDQK